MYTYLVHRFSLPCKQHEDVHRVSKTMLLYAILMFRRGLSHMVSGTVPLLTFLTGIDYNMLHIRSNALTIALGTSVLT